MSENKNRTHLKRKMRQLLPYGLWGAILIAFGLIFYQYVKDVKFQGIPGLLGVFEPIIIGFVITFFMAPFVSAVEKRLYQLQHWIRTTKKKIPVPKKIRQATSPHFGLLRALSMIIGYVIVIGILVIAIVYVIPQLVNSLSTIITLATEFVTDLIGRIEKLSDRWDNLPLSQYINTDDLANVVNSQLGNLTTWVQRLLGNLVPQLYSLIISIASSVAKVIIGLIISIYVVADRERMLRGLKKIVYSLFSKRNAMLLMNIGTETSQIFKFFFLGKIVDSLIIGILCYILMLILRLDYPLLIAVIVGVTNVIPTFGPFIGAVPSALILLMSSPMQTLVFIIMILILQQFDGNILGPYILGGSLGIKPFWIIFSVTVGGGLFGIPGMLFGVPVFAALYTLLSRFFDHRMERTDLNGADLDALENERHTFSHPIIASLEESEQNNQSMSQRLLAIFHKKPKKTNKK